MLTSENVFAISHEAHRLYRLPKGAVGRTMRRFLAPLAARGMLLQSYAFEQGYSQAQLAAIESYARALDDDMQQYLPLHAVQRCGTFCDEPYGIVATHYRFVHDIATASVEQLRDMVKAVAVLASAMHPFAASVNDTALVECPTYTYRGLPCDIAPASERWVVGGHDRMNSSGGVLEWCFDMNDALVVLEAMNRHPGRFSGLNAHPDAQSPVDVARLACEAV